MTDNWEGTRRSWRKLNDLLADADEDTWLELGFWALGLIMMGAAIVSYFGWPGSVFCAGLVLKRISKV